MYRVVCRLAKFTRPSLNVIILTHLSAWMAHPEHRKNKHYTNQCVYHSCSYNYRQFFFNTFYVTQLLRTKTSFFFFCVNGWIVMFFCFFCDKNWLLKKWDNNQLEKNGNISIMLYVRAIKIHSKKVIEKWIWHQCVETMFLSRLLQSNDRTIIKARQNLNI